MYRNTGKSTEKSRKISELKKGIYFGISDIRLADAMINAHRFSNDDWIKRQSKLRKIY